MGIGNPDREELARIQKAINDYKFDLPNYDKIIERTVAWVCKLCGAGDAGDKKKVIEHIQDCHPYWED
jgi:hypothetical protein